MGPDQYRSHGPFKDFGFYSEQNGRHQKVLSRELT